MASDRQSSGSDISPSRRVVSIVTHLDEGGGQTVARNIAGELARRGHDADVWFLYAKRPNIKMLERERVILSKQNPGLLGYLRILYRLVTELSASRPDAVVTHLPLGNVLGQISARFVGVPVRIAVQHTEPWTYKAVIKWMDRAVGTLGFYTHNIAVSETVRGLFAGYPGRYRRYMRVVPNGVRFCPSALTQDEARQAFGLPQKVPLVIAIGRISKEKNLGILIKALSQIDTAHLAIAGKGELREALEFQARELSVQDRVHFVGQVPRDRVPDFIRAGDVCGFPSLYEGLSLALLEIMRSGIPLVASSIPSNVGVLAPSSGGPAAVLVAPKNERGWVKALREMIADEGLRKEYSQRARALSQEFTLERVADAYERMATGSEPNPID